MHTRLFAVLSLALAFDLMAQSSPYNYTVGQPYTSIVRMNGSLSCQTTLYDPEVFSLSPDGALDKTLIMYAQGGASGYPTYSIDSIWSSTRDTFSGAWTQPPGGSPAIVSNDVECDHNGPDNPNTVGPVASPDVVKVNNVWYMAYVGGNADLERGRVYWKKSGDGRNWTDLGPSSSPTPLLVPVDSHHPSVCEKHGVGQVQLAYEAPYFYFFCLYYHFDDPNIWDGPYTTLVYRIRYDSNDAFGLSQVAGDRQMWMGPTRGWQTHNGQLVFDYDDPVNGITKGSLAHNYGDRPGDVIYDPRIGRWIHIFANNTQLLFQTTGGASLDSDWTTPKAITTTLVDSDPRFVANQSKVSPGLWYGSVSQFTPATMYVYMPMLEINCGSNQYAGRTIASAELTVSVGQ